MQQNEDRGHAESGRKKKQRVQLRKEYLQQYERGMPEAYFRRFEQGDIDEHLETFTELSYTRPVICKLDAGKQDAGKQDAPENTLSLTFYILDRPGMFSFLCGVLGSMGFHILEGELYCSTLDQSWLTKVAICTLCGTLDEEAGKISLEEWARQMEEQLLYIFRTLARGSLSLESIQNEVTRLVASKLQQSSNVQPLMRSIDIQVDNKDSSCTKIDVYSENTSFFLYLFAHVLYLQDMNIVYLEIRTAGQRIHDTFWFVSKDGGKVYDRELLNRVRLLVLVSKQLSCFLSYTPDAFRTLYRFGSFIQDLSRKSVEQVLDILLEDPAGGRNLALLLGSSDFIWEDFIRVQQENILPLLSPEHKQVLRSRSGENVKQWLREELASGKDIEEKKRILNTCKDREVFLIDIDHILSKEMDFFFLSDGLTNLAEAVVCAALDIAWEHSTQRYGLPLTVSGLEASWAAFGLGKLGGKALGYASDIELLFLYSDNGSTRGKKRISNREFFNTMFQLAVSLIDARREGIFHVDTRLRPYGYDGPLAVRMEEFVSYYGPMGQAHSVEKLALTRMRHIAGSRKFGRRMTSIRNQLIYQTRKNIVVADIRRARAIQLKEKLRSGSMNVKFSPGGLVDLEYNVQILQVTHGAENPELRVPEIHRALRVLGSIGTIAREEVEYLNKANIFFRNLINGLRMLRGNAQDLFLPPYRSEEFHYLARRLRYSDEGQDGAEKLHADFETYTARVRSFVEHYLGWDTLSGDSIGTIVDLVLNNEFEENDFTTRILKECSFQNYRRALVNLKSLAGSGEQRECFISLIVIVWDILKHSIDADMALNNWERFCAGVQNKAAYYRQLLAQPRRVEVLLSVCSGSAYLADLIISNPDFLVWLSRPGLLTKSRSYEAMLSSLQQLLEEQNGGDFELMLSAGRQREMLRIATRDICLESSGKDFNEITKEISALACATLHAAYNIIAKKGRRAGQNKGEHLCILAFGKLGGMELNYSSDIDLLCIYAAPGSRKNISTEQDCELIVRSLLATVGSFSRSGKGYRIDIRLGPHGSSGKLLHSLSSCLEYYRREAQLWELQAALKLSPVAGNMVLGESFIRDVQSIILERMETVSEGEVFMSMLRRRRQAVAQYASSSGIDVKNGPGGLRDIEFLVQSLQLIHCSKHRDIFCPNTLQALQILRERNITHSSHAEELAESYIFLRKIEHALQIQGDRQLHVVRPGEYRRLAHIILNKEGQTTPEAFASLLEQTRQSVSGYVQEYCARFIPPEVKEKGKNKEGN